jgi:hypothetical protein
MAYGKACRKASKPVNPVTPTFTGNNPTSNSLMMDDKEDQFDERIPS